jgi:hypothetical protein
MDTLSIQITTGHGPDQKTININTGHYPASWTEEPELVAGTASEAAEALAAVSQDLRVPCTLDDILSGIDAARRGNPDYIKIGADGTEYPVGDIRTDHVAVLDRRTGLMWSVESMGSPLDPNEGLPHEKCQERCRELRLLGHSDWRPPSRVELAALIDDTRHEPAIDIKFFPRVKPRWHWTSTAAAWSSASAWLVDFGYGNVSYYHRDLQGFALAVRRAGQ